MADYTVVQTSTLETLLLAVRAHQKEGWTCIGGVNVLVIPALAPSPDTRRLSTGPSAKTRQEGLHLDPATMLYAQAMVST